MSDEEAGGEYGASFLVERHAANFADVKYASANSAARLMIEGMTAALPVLPAMLLRGMLRPRISGLILKLLGEKGATFAPLLRNTVSATIVGGGEKINIHPSEITVELDGRTLPGVTPQQFIDELRRFAINDSIRLEVLRYDSCAPAPDMGMFDLLSDVLKEADKEAIPIPMLLPGGTDGRLFARLSIQTYGFLPMPLSKDMQFTKLIHAADERIPVEAVSFGTDAIYNVTNRSIVKMIIPSPL
nr:M20/M25/M40 family metallo-hydrolase [Paenibacillus alvei]